MNYCMLKKSFKKVGYNVVYLLFTAILVNGFINWEETLHFLNTILKKDGCNVIYLVFVVML